MINPGVLAAMHVAGVRGEKCTVKHWNTKDYIHIIIIHDIII